MSKKSDRPQHPRHVMIYDEDWDYIERNYGRQSGTSAIGSSAVVRALVHKWVQGQRARAQQALDQEVSMRAPTAGMKAEL